MLNRLGSSSRVDRTPGPVRVYGLESRVSRIVLLVGSSFLDVPCSVGGLSACRVFSAGFTGPLRVYGAFWGFRV